MGVVYNNIIYDYCKCVKYTKKISVTLDNDITIFLPDCYTILIEKFYLKGMN